MRIATMRLGPDRKTLEGSTIDAITLPKGSMMFIRRIANSDDYALHLVPELKLNLTQETLAGVAVPVVCNAVWEQVKQ